VIAFDCDSTLSTIEGIDELAGGWDGVRADEYGLAASSGRAASDPADDSNSSAHPAPVERTARRRAEIAALTARAMSGELSLEAVYAARLELVRPTRAAVEALGRRYVATAAPEARELVAALTALGKRVTIVTGGTRAAVLELARFLAIAERDVFAVELRHDARGEYAGFDSRSPLCTQDGKRAVIAALAAEAGPGGVACVGDGVTDAIGARAARRFVAYGGAVRREAVFRRAQATSAERSLAGLLRWLVSPAELARLRSLGGHGRLLALHERFVAGA
jgi:phosphoserine phosphatase